MCLHAVQCSLQNEVRCTCSRAEAKKDLTFLMPTAEEKLEEERAAQLACHPEGSCKFFLLRKRRLCRLPALPGSSFCCSHGGSTNGRKRVVCPYNAKQCASSSLLSLSLERES